jgi:hypothetical protein
MNYRNDLTQSYLKSILHYDPTNGIFIWIRKKIRISQKDVAGWLSDGRVFIDINCHSYLAHRLAWLYITGDWPKEEIDHINMIRNDNRWCNLREATHSQNFHNRIKYRNNRSGIKGVCWNKKAGKWMVEIMINKVKIYLGLFSNLDEARKVRENASIEYHKNFARLK